MASAIHTSVNSPWLPISSPMERRPPNTAFLTAVPQPLTARSVIFTSEKEEVVKSESGRSSARANDRSDEPNRGHRELRGRRLDRLAPEADRCRVALAVLRRQSQIPQILEL